MFASWSRRYLRNRLRRARLCRQQGYRPTLETLEKRDLPTGPWFPLAQPVPGPGHHMGTMLLLSDGTVMVQDDGGYPDTGNGWYRLTPDSFGSYVKGTWSPLQPMLTGRLDYASAVLPSGKVFVAGGEHSTAGEESSLGEIFDPTANFDPATNTDLGSWTPISSPAGPLMFSKIGDGMSEALPNDRVLVGPEAGGRTLIYNLANDQWSAGPILNNVDQNSEEGWVKLPDGSILDYELEGMDPQTGQRLIFGATDSQDTWVSAGSVPVNLGSYGGNFGIAPELGPGFLLPNGSVFWVGASSNTALYNPITESWAPGPTIPGGLGGFDAPGAVEPDGKVLFAAGPQDANFPGPTSIFEYDPTTNSIADVTPTPPNSPNMSMRQDYTRMLVLPSGDILFNDNSNQLWVYNTGAAPSATWRPTITRITNNVGSFTLTGTQLNGLDEGAAFGDDAQMASNFPIIELTSADGTVSFARTFNWSSTWVDTGSTPESTQFTLPAAITPGVYRLSVIANGIPSNPVLFVEMGAGANSLSLRVKPGDSSRLQVLQAGTLLAEYPFSSLPGGIMVAGDPGPDALTLDLSNGNPIPAAGISYDGGGSDNEILVSGSTALTCALSDTGLTLASAGTLPGSVSLRRVDEAVLTGGPFGNDFELSGWSGVAQVNGEGATNNLSVTAPAGANVSVTGSVVTFGSTSVGYSDIQSIGVGGGGGDTFTLSPGLHDLDELPATVTIHGGGSSTAILDDQNLTPEFSSAWTVSGLNVTRSYSTLFFINSNPVWITTTRTINYGGISALTLNGGADSEFTLSPVLHSLNELPATVTIHGGTSSTAVLNDQGNAAATTYELTAGSLVRAASTFLPTILYSSLAGLTLNAGSGGNQIDVAGTAAATPVTVNAGAGGDAINVTLPGLQSLLTVNGAAGVGRLFLNDQGDTASTGYTIAAGSVARSSGSVLLPSISYSALAALTLNAGNGGNQIYVTGTMVNTPVTVNAGPSGDTINLGSIASLAGILAPVTVNGQGSTDRLTLFDQLNPASTTYYISAGDIERVTSTSLPSILYSNLAGLTLYASNGHNTIYVEQTAANTSVTVNASASNTINLGGVFLGTMAGIRAPVTVNGAGSSDQVVLSDVGNFTTADQVTATATGVTSSTSGSFFGPGGSLTYDFIGTVTINTSNAPQGDNITVYPASGLAFVVNGGSPTTPPGDSLIVEPLNGTVLTQHSTGTGAGFYTLGTGTTQLVTYTGIETVSPVGLLAVGVDAGQAPDVHVYDAQSGVLKYDLHPFTSAFQGGVRVAVGDVNGDGIPDIVTAEGDGGGTVQVFDGATGQPLSGPLGSFTPFGPDYHHGLWVAAADVNGDGYADIVVGEDAGGEPRVRIFSGQDGSLLADFLAFDPSFHGGVRVAAADFNHDHHADIATGQGPGGQIVNVFEGANLSSGDQTPTPAFTILQPFTAAFHQGVYVATGDVFGDGTPRVLVSQGAGPDPDVAVFDGAASGNELARFVVRGFQDGARVAAADINGDGRSDIIVGAVQGDAVVRGYDGLSLQEDGHLAAFGPDYRGGIFVGGFGRWGDFATAVGRTLSGPQGELQTALADLTTIQASLADSQDSGNLADALDLLSTALNAPAWVDSSHLQPNGGSEVFADEEAAVQMIANLIQHSRGAVPGQQMENDLSQIVQSDEELAQIAIAEAGDADPQRLREAQAALQNGQNDFAAAFAGGTFKSGLLDDALEDFRQAWSKASKVS